MASGGFRRILHNSSKLPCGRIRPQEFPNKKRRLDFAARKRQKALFCERHADPAGTDPCLRSECVPYQQNRSSDTRRILVALLNRRPSYTPYFGELMPLRQSAWAVANHDKDRSTMITGTVKWFDPHKGYGFIAPDDGSKDAFVHISAVERASIPSLSEGQRVSYDLQRGQNGKSSAENLKLA